MYDRPCPTVTTSLASLLFLAFMDSLVFMSCISPFIILVIQIRFFKNCKWGRQVFPKLPHDPLLAGLGEGISQVSGFLPDKMFCVF